MKIVFLCGSLEPGHNGVGDYIRILAKELISVGHNVSIIALYDLHVNALFDGFQVEAGSEVPVLRIPSNYSVSDRVSAARRFVIQFDPEWISLQFVPFSFHSKGLPIGLYEQLAKLGSGYKWHVMLHELWVGKEPGTNWKRGIYATLQKLLIQRLLKRLRPTLIHTHLPVYKNQLERLGFKVLNLPLFSNIRVVNNLIELRDEPIVRVGMFSQVGTNSYILDFLTDVSSQTKQSSKTLEVLLIGGNNHKMSEVAHIISSQSGFIGKVICTGFLDPHDVSLSLHKCTLGLTPVPRHGLGKSGSVAAFLSHGVPVAAPNYSAQYDKQDIGFFADSFKAAIMVSSDLTSVNCFRAKASDVKNELKPSVIAKKFELDLIG